MRKELKKRAKQHVRKHYWLFVTICLIAAVMGIAYTGSISYFTTDTQTGSNTVLIELIEGNFHKGEEISKENTKILEGRREQLGVIALEHSRGVLAGVFNNVSSGSYIISLVNAVRSIGMSRNNAIVIFIILACLVRLGIHVFFINPFKIVYERVFMEACTYDKVPVNRFLFLFQTERFWNGVKTIFLVEIYKLLWMLTIVGAFIKPLSYKMVPFIMAENPDLKPNEAITLSRKMMNGHKWEALVLSLSFLGWDLLGHLTMGLSEILFSSPYNAATQVEYYKYIRSLSKENQIENSEKLNDLYLFEKAEKELLYETYENILPVLNEELPEIKKHGGIRGFLENVFGVTPIYDKEEQEYQLAKAKVFQTKAFRDVLDQKIYPRRLFPLKNSEKIKKIRSLHYDRHYSVSSIVLIFFCFSNIGWLWEVSLHLIEEGVFRNRGVMHGPWLPVYGSGCVLILICLNKFRKNPMVQFFSAIVLCGVVEYVSGWWLEMTHNGEKWWDYSGYLINIDGRVCAEGLLVFGLGGIGIVYFLAPALDNQFHHLKMKTLRMVSVILLLLFLGDMIYSHYSPNTGEGITSTPEQKSAMIQNSKLEQEEKQADIIINDNGAIVRRLKGGSGIHV